VTERHCYAKDYSLDVTPANAQRRPGNAMSDAWIREFLSRTHLGHVATRWDEQPFITPTTFWYDPSRHVIYFHSNIVGGCAPIASATRRCALKPANTASSCPRMWL